MGSSGGGGGGHGRPPGGVLGALRSLDAFPKVNEDFFQKTMSGGIITVVAYAFMVLLFLSETSESDERQRASCVGVGVAGVCLRTLRSSSPFMYPHPPTTPQNQTNPPHTHPLSQKKGSTWRCTAPTSSPSTLRAERPSPST